MTFEPLYPPYDPTDKTGFVIHEVLMFYGDPISLKTGFREYETVVKRWPVIITGVIDQVHNVCHKLSLELQQPNTEKETAEAKVAEGKVIIEKLSKLKYQMGRDHPLEPIPADGEGQVETYNLELQRLGEAGKNTWFTAPWLYAECYLYRLLRSFCATTTHWNNYDPFLSQKVSTFAQSGTSILKIATSMHELESEKDALNAEKLGILFSEMVQMCLWGNATDLSLLTHLSPDDIAHLQSVGKEAQAARQQFILKDDQSQLWEHIQSLKSGRIDFVLDNAGFELFTDLVFADFLVSFTPYVWEVQFHPKLIPWFVSDVTPADFSQTLSSLLDPSFFSQLAGSNEGSTPSSEHLKHMVTRWKNYVDEGVFKLSVPLTTPLGGSRSEVDLFASFWTSPWPYWNLKDYAPELFSALQESSLVVFKGDLNYRKLTGDIQWPVWTAFATAIGPLAGSFPILSLRTNKADVVVGVDREIAEKLDESSEKWRVNGRYALISFLEASPLESANTS